MGPTGGTPPGTAPARRRRGVRWRGTWALTAVVLTVGLLATAALAGWRSQAEERDARAHLELLTDDVAESMATVMAHYGHLVEGIAAHASLGDLDHDTYRRYVSALDLDELPGEVHTAFVRRVERDDLAEHLSRYQGEEALHPVIGPGPVHGFAVHTHPPAPFMLGIDLFADPARRAAIEAATERRDTVVALLGDRVLGVESSVLSAWTPVFASGAGGDDGEAPLLGWVTARVSAPAVVRNLEDEAGSVLAAAYAPGTGELIAESRPGAAEAIGEATTVGTAAVTVGGDTVFELRTRLLPGAGPSSAVWLIVVGGVLVTVLAAYVVHGELRARRGLEALAAEEHDRAALLQSRFHAAVYRAPVGVAVFDLTGHVEVVNDPLYELLGITPGTTSPQVLDYFLPEDQLDVLQKLAQLADGSRSIVEGEYQIQAPGGPRRWVRISCASILSPDDQPVAVVAHVQDIEAERAAQEALRSRTRWFSSIVERSSDMILLFDSGGLVTWASPSLENLLGISPEAIVGQPIQRFVHPDDRATVERAMAKVAEEGNARVEFRVTTEAGERWLETTASNLLDDPDVRAIITISRDVTERYLSTQQLAHRAEHDPLTSLLNRAALEARLGEALGRVPEEPLTVAYLDLDGFKPVNDDNSHRVGDELLKMVARIIETEVRQQDLIARFGGDEFVLALRGASLSVAIEVADRIRRRLREPIPLDEVDQPVRISASVGLAAARPGDTVTGLIHAADLALYEAKRRGRDRVEVSTRTLQEAGAAELDEQLEEVARQDAADEQLRRLQAERSAEVLPEEREGPLPG